MGLLDSLFNKENKLLSKARKDIARVDMLEKSGRRGEALSDLEKTSAMLRENMMYIGKLKHDFSQVFAAVGVRYISYDKAQQANDAARVSLQLDPSNPEAMGVAGRASLRLGNKAEGMNWLLKAVAVAPQSAELWSVLGEAHDASGMPRPRSKAIGECSQYTLKA